MRYISIFVGWYTTTTRRYVVLCPSGMLCGYLTKIELVSFILSFFIHCDRFPNSLVLSSNHFATFWNLTSCVYSSMSPVSVASTIFTDSLRALRECL